MTVDKPSTGMVPAPTLDQIQAELAAARLATRRQARLLGLVESDGEDGRVSPNNESNDKLTPLPDDAGKGPAAPPWVANHTRTSPGLSELMSSSASPREEDWYFSPVHSESSTRTSSRWQASPSSSRTTPPSAHSKEPKKANTNRSPRVKNTGKVLAPHGTFTSRKAVPVAPALPSPSGESSHSHHSHHSSRSRSSREHLDAIENPDLTDAERSALEKSASRGDQLAMYRLGWLAHRPGTRYSLGLADHVWGPVEPAQIVRSSARTSISSPAALPENVIPTPGFSNSASVQLQRRTTTTDLFADAARLTLSSPTEEKKSYASYDYRKLKRDSPRASKIKGHAGTEGPEERARVERA